MNLKSFVELRRSIIMWMFTDGGEWWILEQARFLNQSIYYFSGVDSSHHLVFLRPLLCDRAEKSCSRSQSQVGFLFSFCFILCRWQRVKYIKHHSYCWHARSLDDEPCRVQTKKPCRVPPEMFLSSHGSSSPVPLARSQSLNAVNSI